MTCSNIDIDYVLRRMHENGVTIVSLLCAVLRGKTSSQAAARQDLITSQGYTDLLTAFNESADTSGFALDSAHQLVKKEYSRELLGLTTTSAGYRFNASKVSADSILEFSSEKMAENIQKRAPRIWDLLGELLESELDQWHREITFGMAGTSGGPSSAQELDDSSLFSAPQHSEPPAAMAPNDTVSAEEQWVHEPGGEPLREDTESDSESDDLPTSKRRKEVRSKKAIRRRAELSRIVSEDFWDLDFKTSQTVP